MNLPHVGAPGGRKISKDALLITGGGILAAYFLWKASQPSASLAGIPATSGYASPSGTAGGAVNAGAGAGDPGSVVGQATDPFAAWFASVGATRLNNKDYFWVPKGQDFNTWFRNLSNAYTQGTGNVVPSNP